MPSFKYRPMKIIDYEQVYVLWQNTEGIGLSEADSKKNIAEGRMGEKRRYLRVF